ncbi:MAG TPA: hypothetical protein VH475_10820 [Tepidisphaeraceae bacterium]|jgi:hypothetical protein
MADISAEADTAIYLEHCDPERNTSRFYALSVHPTLFKAPASECGRLCCGDRPTAEVTAAGGPFMLACMKPAGRVQS